MPNAVSDSLKMVTFAAPAYVSALRSSEPLVGAYASVVDKNNEYSGTEPVPRTAAKQGFRLDQHHSGRTTRPLRL